MNIYWPVRFLGKVSSFLGRIGERYERCAWLEFWEEVGMDMDGFLPIDANRYILTGKDADGTSLMPGGRVRKEEPPSGN